MNCVCNYGVMSKQKCCCDQKYAVSVECCKQDCYCELVTKVVYNNFQDILVPLGDRYSALGNTRNSLSAFPTFQLFIHATNHWSQQHFSSWMN